MRKAPAPRPVSAADLSARVDALLAAGVLHPDRPLLAHAPPTPPRRPPAGAPPPRSRGRATPTPASTPAPDAPLKGRTLRQQLASAQHRLRYWTQRAAELEAVLERHGLVPPPAKIVSFNRRQPPPLTSRK